MMAKQSKLSRLSSLVSTAGFIVDGYNGLKYSAKNRRLSFRIKNEPKT